MNLKQAALKEHSKSQCNKIVKYIGNDPKKFSELVDVFLAGPYRVSQRIAWPLSCCIEENTTLIHPHLTKVLKYAQRSDVHDSVKRNVVRLLQFIDIPKKHQGTVADVCFKFFNNAKESIAVRVFSMTVLANLAKQIPELKNELIPIIEDQLPYGSAGFVSRGRKVLKDLKV
ncbi:MAG: hypothetical protein HY015_04640 [Bacteroidetes bacterium]|nr:hypothetical protein [Bacteroidota bacterium]MBI3482247.1 hypothetical protein [Bacteroidota bacterium]